MTTVRTRDAAAVLAAAFHDGALLSWAQPDEARRAVGARGVFRGTWRHCTRHGGVHAIPAVDAGPAAEVGPVVAVAGWVPASHLDLGLADLLRTGLLVTPLWLGPQATVRVERHERPTTDRLRAHRRPDDAYLWVLGALPAVQGTGRGAAVLDEALVAMAAAGHARCLLRTDDAVNVPWYERRGFTVDEHLDAVPSGLPAWILSRPLR